MIDPEILDGVRGCVAEALDLDSETINPSDRIMGDLGADSLDLLDISFRLERRFQIVLNPREIERRTKERLAGQPMETDGVYTEAALAELRQAMPGVPPEEIRTGLTTAQLPRLFRVATLAGLVEKLRSSPGKAEKETG